MSGNHTRPTLRRTENILKVPQESRLYTRRCAGWHGRLFVLVLMFSFTFTFFLCFLSFLCSARRCRKENGSKSKGYGSLSSPAQDLNTEA